VPGHAAAKTPAQSLSSHYRLGMPRRLRATLLAATTVVALVTSAMVPLSAAAASSDGPRVTSVDVGPRFLPRKMLAELVPGVTVPDPRRNVVVRVSTSAAGAAVQYQERWFIGGKNEKFRWSGASTWSTKHAYRKQVVEGATLCYRFRARAGGVVGPWSSMRCTSMPIRGAGLAPSNCGPSDAGVKHQRARTCTNGSKRSWHFMSGNAVRVGFLGGKGAGSFDVYAGGTKIGHVWAGGTSAGLHHRTFEAPKHFRGFVDFRGTRGNVEIHDWLVLP